MRGHCAVPRVNLLHLADIALGLKKYDSLLTNSVSKMLWKYLEARQRMQMYIFHNSVNPTVIKQQSFYDNIVFLGSETFITISLLDIFAKISDFLT